MITNIFLNISIEKYFRGAIFFGSNKFIEKYYGFNEHANHACSILITTPLFNFSGLKNTANMFEVEAMVQGC